MVRNSSSPLIKLFRWTVLYGVVFIVVLRYGIYDNSQWANAAQIVASIIGLATLVGRFSQLSVQTIAAILASAQDASIRSARAKLFGLEENFH